MLLQALTRGLAALQASQLASGEVPIELTTELFPQVPNDTSPYAWQHESTPYVTALALHSLGFLPGGEARAMGERCARFLIACRGAEPLWYWNADGLSPHFLPPDADDTACAAAALLEWRWPFDARSLAKTLEPLRASNGRFHSWLMSFWDLPAGKQAPFYDVCRRLARDRRYGQYVERKSERSVREAFSSCTEEISNINVLMFLSLIGEKRPDVEADLLAHTRALRFTRGTDYYPSPLAYAYFFTRALADGLVTAFAAGAGTVRDFLLEAQHADGSWGSALDTAMGLTALLNAGCWAGTEQAARRAVDSLLRSQQADGHWPRAALVWAARRRFGVPMPCYGSCALTTTLALEALAKFLWRAQCGDRPWGLRRGSPLWSDVAGRDLGERLDHGAARPTCYLCRAWSIIVQGRARARLLPQPGTATSVRVEVEKGSWRRRPWPVQAWLVQLSSSGLVMEAGLKYELRYRLRASRPKPIGCGVGRAYPDWRNLGCYERLLVGPGWLAHATELTPTESEPRARLHFDLAEGPAAVVEIDQVVIEPR